MSSDPDATTSPIAPRESVIGRALVSAADRLTAAADDSALLGIARRCSDRAVAIATDSTIADGGRFLARVTRHSWLFRWLTAEPEPEVIVIDLRETWTVGPVIRLLDHVFDRLAGSITESRAVAFTRALSAELHAAPLRVAGVVAISLGLVTLGTSLVSGGLTLDASVVLSLALLAGGVFGLRDGRSWDALRETPPVRLLIAALEPPDPPESAEPIETDQQVTTSRSGSDAASGDETVSDEVGGADEAGSDEAGSGDEAAGAPLNGGTAEADTDRECR